MACCWAFGAERGRFLHSVGRSGVYTAGSPVTSASTAPDQLQMPTPARLWTVEALLAPSARYLALFVIAVSFFFPVGGLGFDLCMLHASTGLPCPGCGMSRAISAISQGDFSAAVGLNPFAFFAWPAFLALSVLALLPKSLRVRIEAQVRNTPKVARFYELIFWSFLGFGLIRLAVFLVLQERFP